MSGVAEVMARVRRIEEDQAEGGGWPAVALDLTTRRGMPRATVVLSLGAAADLARDLADATLWADPPGSDPMRSREARRLAVSAALDDPPDLDYDSTGYAMASAWSAARTAFAAGEVEVAGTIAAAVRIAAGARGEEAGGYAMEAVWGVEALSRLGRGAGNG